ncbi:MAG: anti-sigma factor family protein [Vicinamibacterales bacterium]
MIPYLGCQGARGMLEAFVDGELPVSGQVALEAHLRWCDTCRARVEDMRLIGSALRLGSAASAADHTDAAALATMYDEVVMRVRAERDQSLAVQWRELFTDMRYLWPALGATVAVILCLCASTFVSQIARAERPNSLAALISIMASPGSDENPLHLESGMLAPRTLDVGPSLAGIAEEEAVYAVAAVVTREGRVSNYELLQSVREPLVGRRGVVPVDEVTAVLNAVRHSRFEPAQTTEGAVAVNMVWLLARTTVKAPAKPEEADPGPVSAVPARAVLRPARS